MPRSLIVKQPSIRFDVCPMMDGFCVIVGRDGRPLTDALEEFTARQLMRDLNDAAYAGRSHLNELLSSVLTGNIV